MKSLFLRVILISHLDSLKDCVDQQIIIDKKEDDETGSKMMVEEKKKIIIETRPPYKDDNVNECKIDDADDTAYILYYYNTNSPSAC